MSLSAVPVIVTGVNNMPDEIKKEKQMHWYDGLISFLEYTGILNEMRKDAKPGYRGVPMLGHYDKEVPVRSVVG